MTAAVLKEVMKGAHVLEFILWHLLYNVNHCILQNLKIT
jgi:hypothetical protein